MGLDVAAVMDRRSLFGRLGGGLGMLLAGKLDQVPRLPVGIPLNAGPMVAGLPIAGELVRMPGLGFPRFGFDRQGRRRRVGPRRLRAEDRRP